jgi:hypothetical protein
MGPAWAGPDFDVRIVPLPAGLWPRRCLSTHWPIGGGQIEEWMRDHLPQPGNHRLFFDFGGRGLDRQYGIHHMRVNGFLQQAGWKEGSDYLIRWFPRRYP